jgi:hypothetical protein
MQYIRRARRANCPVAAESIMKPEIVYDKKSDLWLAIDDRREKIQSYVTLEEAMEAHAFRINRESYRAWKIEHKRRVKSRGFS